MCLTCDTVTKLDNACWFFWRIVSGKIYGKGNITCHVDDVSKNDVLIIKCVGEEDVKDVNTWDDKLLSNY